MNRHLLAILVGCATQLLATAADARSSLTALGTSLLLREAEIAIRHTITRSM
jgi:hypothetical protein